MTSDLLQASARHVRHARQLVLNARALARTADERAEVQVEGFHKRLVQEAEWVETITQLSDTLWDAVDLDQAVVHARSSWTPHPAVQAARKLWSAVRRDSNAPTPPTVAEVAAALTSGLNPAAWAAGGLQLYLAQALRTSEVAGSFALRHLGVKRPFVWAHPQNMARDLFQVRGSKVIQQAYGTHIDALSQIIIRATDPANPLTIGDVVGHIREQWPALQRYQAERIARTETAAVWTTTSVNAYAANGIAQVESTIAHGPSIGVDTDDPCDECADFAASGPYDIDDMPDTPPLHPQCRCELLPILDDENGDPWLPPDDAWTGGDGADLTEAPSPDAGE